MLQVTVRLGSIQRAEAALSEALGRMDVAWRLQDTMHFENASVEAMMWVVAMDDHLRADPAYVSRRDGDVGGRIVRGLRWARNAAVHQLVSVHVTPPQGMTFPMTFPLTFERAATWRPRTEISGVHRRQPDNEAAYDSAIAGQPVQQTLRDAAHFLMLTAARMHSDQAP